MSSQDLHQLNLRWPHTDANEVIVTGTFDQWSSSLRLTRKPDGFETPIFIPWRDKIAYKFIVDGRWMTNDTEPTEIDHGFVNNVYTAPPKPASQEPQHAPAPPSSHSESEVKPEHAEKAPVHVDKPVVNGSALDELHEAPTSTADPEPEKEKSSALIEDVKAAVTPTLEAALPAIAQVAPDSRDVEKASDELAPKPQPPKELVLPVVPSQVPSDPEDQRSTHVPIHFVTGSSATAVVAQGEEPSSTPAPESEPEVTRDADATGTEVPAEVAQVRVENEVSTSPAPEDTEPPKEAILVPSEEAKTSAAPESAPTSALAAEPEPETTAPVVEPVPEPVKVETPAAAETEVVSAPEHEVAVTSAAKEESTAAIPESSVPAPSPTPALAVEQASAPAKNTGPTPAAEPAATTVPESKADVKTSDAPSSLPSVPAVSGHTKSASTSTASASTPAPSLPSTPTRKASRKFSFPHWDKSGNTSPTGSSRFSSHQKREKRHSLLGKLKEIFGDKDKKEKDRSVKA